MKRGLQVAAPVMGLLALGYVITSFQYSLGSMARPGPGFFPLIVGAAMLVASIGIGVHATFVERSETLEWPRGAALRRVLALLVAVLAYVILLPFIGFPILAAVVVLVVMLLMGERRWSLLLLVAASMSVASYFLFAFILKVPLPAYPGL